MERLDLAAAEAALGEFDDAIEAFEAFPVGEFADGVWLVEPASVQGAGAGGRGRGAGVPQAAGMCIAASLTGCWAARCC